MINGSDITSTERDRIKFNIQVDAEQLVNHIGYADTAEFLRDLASEFDTDQKQE